MTEQMEAYVRHVRTNTAYPTYRAIIGTLAALGYILAGLYGLGSVLGGMAMLSMESEAAAAGMIIGGLFSAILIFVLTRFCKEAATVMVDFADATIERNSRTSRPNK